MSVQNSPEFTEQPSQVVLEAAPRAPLYERVQARWAELEEAHMWARLPGALGAMVVATFGRPNL